MMGDWSLSSHMVLLPAFCHLPRMSTQLLASPVPWHPKLCAVSLPLPRWQPGHGREGEGCILPKPSSMIPGYHPAASWGRTCCGHPCSGLALPQCTKIHWSLPWQGRALVHSYLHAKCFLAQRLQSSGGCLFAWVRMMGSGKRGLMSCPGQGTA